MKRAGWNVFVRWGGVMLALLCSPFVVVAQEYEQLSRGVVKLTVSKEQGRGTGAGIVLGREDGVVFVLTALHVVAQANKIEAEFFDKRNFLFEAKPIESQYDPLDLAVVRIEPRPGIATPTDFPSFTLGAVDELKLGATMSSIGHAQEDWQLNPRMHALSKKESMNDVQRFRFSDPGVGGGSSGGPVFDEQGRLLGMITEEAGGGGHAVAVKIDAAERQLKGWKVPLDFLGVVSKTAVPSPPAPSRPAVPPGMVPVPAGEFFMGCNEKGDEECEADEKPGKTVTLAAFQIDTTEVTVAAYRRCVEAGQCTTDGVTMPYWGGKEQPVSAWACNWGKAGRDDHPINCVDWSQAEAYCKWAGKRLPTEAEWEKAARGADGRKYSWGSIGFAQAGKVANIADRTARKQNANMTWALEDYDDGYYGTAPVGSFPAGESPFHALDPTGNVWEWTADWYVSDYYKNGPSRNPKGPDRGDSRSVRGGSWDLLPQYARASYRDRVVPGDRSVSVGFRCAQ